MSQHSEAPISNAAACAAKGQTENVETVLAVRGLGSGYGKRAVLFDIAFEVHEEEIVTVLGHNGAGKTTLLKTILGMLPAVHGSLVLGEREVTHASYVKRVSLGIAYSPAEAAVFRGLTVDENLMLGGFHSRDAVLRDRMQEVFTIFPALAEKRKDRAGGLSGGQQRMLGIGIALMTSPKLLLMDEPSLGLAPSLVRSLFDQIRVLTHERGMGLVIVEQNVPAALRIADRAIFIRSGRVILDADAAVASARSNWWDLF